MPRVSSDSRSANSGGIILKVADRSSAPSALLENFASAPSAQPIDAHQPARICRRCPASCSAAGSGSQPPAGSAAAWPSPSLSGRVIFVFGKRLSSFSSYLRFLHRNRSMLPTEPHLCFLRNPLKITRSSPDPSLFHPGWPCPWLEPGLVYRDGEGGSGSLS